MTDTRATDQPELRLQADELHAYVCAIWERAGSSAREARLVADHLVAANLAGHDSHGVGMIPRYADSLHDNELKLNRHAEIIRDAGAVLTVDGGKGFGQVAGFEAMELGVERAKRHGICAVGLRGAHHLGRIGHWGEQCAAAGMASFHFVNVAGDPLVAPFGGADRRFGTNPFCAAYPRDGKPPFVLDFATSAIAYGKTRVAYNKGKTVPADCLIDAEGRPTIEPKVMHETPFGALLPFAAHKGYGLAVLCELFGGALTGGLTTHAATLETTNAIVNGMLSIIIDPQAFDAHDGQAQAEAFVAWAKASPLAAGAGQVLMPGEPELATQAARRAQGIPIDPATWQQISDAALELGMTTGEIGRYSESARRSA
ncbi:malate/lactate/ureidoglycolate dehydrogenase [Trinickia terrae]|uniref:Malate/lactate/ureidoglycolate dehydrogenase n=1 Tax=Trinickia terrae TaxID=2571161 RepID=A0A4U1IFL2_9BURK|nr:malate/lactate/ureidoglycolate dehydrogenase [Trinickia terrae]TKC92472.1 malate/lactate/ureidoglycolate dehydrogenase [Trinickia terrae]